jgi:hypothetical protein
MASLRFRLTQAIAIGLLVNLGTTSAFARAAGTAHDRWNPAHIDQLPQEVRGNIARTCGASRRAEHEFATYRENGRVITLHFEHLRCGTTAAACKQEGCLRQVYAPIAGHYRLVKSYYGPQD